MRKFTQFILLSAAFLTTNTAGADNLQTSFIAAEDTAVYHPGGDIPDIPYTPADTIYIAEPDTIDPTLPPVVIPGPSIEGKNVVEYLHSPSNSTQQDLSFSLEGEYLRVKGCIWAIGNGKHYLDYQIIGDSVILQRIDMDIISSIAMLHDIDVRIPGFTENSYRVSLDEYMNVEVRYKHKTTVTRGNGEGTTQIAEQQTATSKRVHITRLTGSAVKLTFSEAIAQKGNIVHLYKVDGSEIEAKTLGENRDATFNNLSQGIYLYRLRGESTCSGKIIVGY